MLLRLLLLFTLLPVVELMLLVKLHELTSWPVTIGVVLLTGVVGASLARRQGWQNVRRMQDELAAGRVPTDSILDGILILVAGAMLITPGLLTDTTGFLLLIPPVRRRLRQRLVDRFRQRFVVRAFGPGWSDFDSAPRSGRDEIIDARVVSPPRSEPIGEE